MTSETANQERTRALKALLEAGEATTQSELLSKLRKQGFDVTQPTISRDLRKIGAVKTTDEFGQTTYQLLSREEAIASQNLSALVLKILHNHYLVVIHTAVGSANVVASQLDRVLPAGILGTIAGDDTIFVAPQSTKSIEKTIEEIKKILGV